MYLLVLFCPLIACIFSLFFGRFIGSKGVSFMTTFSLFISLICSLFIFYEVGLSGSTCIIKLYKWVDLGYFFVDIVFFFDVVTCVMLVVVTFISFFVHMYSVEYMGHDPCLNRFMSYLSLFTFFMLLLVTSDNFIQMFIGWEGVGLSSYLLISFWYSRILANKAAIKAMLVNRIGDLALLIAISVIFLIFGSVKYTVLFNICSYFFNYTILIFNIEFELFFIVCLFLFFGAMGKSAQLGLHMWLPDAMEGPTPVSALIHAATMVTAGVFLVVRCSYFFEYDLKVLFFVGLIGGLTCFFSSIIGAFQFDIKKIVAYSTCSQLGYMFFSAGLSNYSISLFHLFNHAFFKALLFLSMGSIIHALSDEQDFRRMGGLIRLLPFTYVMVLIGSVALMGFPFLTGFYSKDFLLELAYARFTVSSHFFYWLGIFAAFFTAYYSTRLIYWVFFSKPNFYKSYLNNIHEPSIYMALPMFVLGICSIFVGYIFSEAFNGVGTNFFGSSIYLNIQHYVLFDSEFSLFFIKYMPLIISLLGIFIFFTINKYVFVFFMLFKYMFFLNLYKFFTKAMFFDVLFVDTFFVYIMKISYLYIYKYIEKRMLEFICIFFIFSLFRKFYNFIKRYQQGLVFNFVFLIIFFFIYFFLIFEFSIYMDFIFLFTVFIFFVFNLNI